MVFFEFGGLGKEGEVMRVGDWTVDRVEGWKGSFMGRLVGRVYSRLDGCKLLVRVYSMDVGRGAEFITGGRDACKDIHG